MSGSDAADLVESLVGSFVHEEKFVENGEFLPLGVWGTRGFNTVDIETKSPDVDVKMHPVLGKLYRVRLPKSQNSDTQLVRRDTALTSRKKRPFVECEEAIEDEPTPAGAPLAIKDKESSSSKGSSSSRSASSSSSSDRKKRSKKHKKDKKRSKKDKKRSKKDKKDKAKKDKVRENTCVQLAMAAKPHTTKIHKFLCHFIFACLANPRGSTELASRA